jgi:hypothetical protein
MERMNETLEKIIKRKDYIAEELGRLKWSQYSRQFLGISKLCLICIFASCLADAKSDFVVYSKSWVSLPSVVDMDVDVGTCNHRGANLQSSVFRPGLFATINRSRPGLNENESELTATGLIL